VEIKIVEKNGRQYIEGIPGQKLLHEPQDAVNLIGECLGRGIDRVLLYEANLTDGFFRLATGEAGEILQKFRNYGIKTAAVVAPERAERGKFREMALEENRGKDFHVFAGRAQAEEWLIGD